jgi:DNA-binding NarL/FixJ family response regulator
VAETVGDDTLRQLFASRASAQLPRSRPAASARRLAKQRFEGLTEREREVAALIAEGRSNRQIAEALVLSERTIAAHVANIFSKLGFNSRAQVAAWATSRGLGEAGSGPDSLPDRDF